MGGGVSKADYAKLEATLEAEKVASQKRLEDCQQKEAAALAEAKGEKKSRQDIEIQLGSKIATLEGRLNQAIDRLSSAARLEVHYNRMKAATADREKELGRRCWEQYQALQSASHIPATSTSSVWRRAKAGILRMRLQGKEQGAAATMEETRLGANAATESLAEQFEKLKSGQGAFDFTHADARSLGLNIASCPSVPQLCHVTGFTRGPGDISLPAEEDGRISPNMLLVSINQGPVWGMTLTKVIFLFQTKLGIAKKPGGTPLVLTFAESPLKLLAEIEKYRFNAVVAQLKHEAISSALFEATSPEPEKESEKELELQAQITTIMATIEKERLQFAALEMEALQKAKDLEEMSKSMHDLEAKVQSPEAKVQSPVRAEGRMSASSALSVQSNAEESSTSFSAYDKAAEDVVTSRARDYSVLVDASASMRLKDRDAYGRSRWDLARETLELLVPHVVERDNDGITLYFFSSGYRKISHVNSVDAVKWSFFQETPKGGTMLAEALADAIIPDNLGRPETILVITDGAPENRHAVETVIQNASERMTKEDDIRIVFVQVGNDQSASRWLASLPQSLQCKYDIVETVSSKQLAKTGVPFAQWVSQSVLSNTYLEPLSTFGNSGYTSPTREYSHSREGTPVARPSPTGVRVLPFDEASQSVTASQSAMTIATPLGGHFQPMNSLVSCLSDV